MKTVVLDATELRKDWLLTGVTARLLGHAVMQDHLRVCVPPSVVEEIIAHHGRAVSDQRSKLAGVKQEWARLGLGDLAAPTTQFDVRDYLRKRFDEILSFEVLGWPTISHAELVSRAVSRTPPFDDKGGGYRDSLVWANALELARAGADVVLVTADNGFKRTDDTLHDLLRDEVSALGHGGGNVELVRDLTPWLLQNLPWKAENARSAIALARRNDFAEFLHQIDLTEYVDIDPPALGFESPPFKVEFDGVFWDGDLEVVESAKGVDGLSVTEYDMGASVSFEALLPDTIRIEEDWEVLRHEFRGGVSVRAQTSLTARVAVLYDDELGFSFDTLSWRRTDGAPPTVMWRDPTEVSLFDFPADRTA